MTAASQACRPPSSPVALPPPRRPSAVVAAPRWQRMRPTISPIPCTPPPIPPSPPPPHRRSTPPLVAAPEPCSPLYRCVHVFRSWPLTARTMLVHRQQLPFSHVDMTNYGLPSLASPCLSASASCPPSPQRPRQSSLLTHQKAPTHQHCPGLAPTPPTTPKATPLLPRIITAGGGAAPLPSAPDLDLDPDPRPVMWPS